MAYTEQPEAHPAMVASNNRNVKNLPVGPGGRDWSNGLCGCCDDAGTCIVAWLLPCVIYSQVKHRYEHLHSRGYPDPENGGGCCNSDCMIHGLIHFLGYGFVLVMLQRGSIRARYNIRGGGCGDCCASYFCVSCVLTQEAREIQLEEQSFNGQH